MSSLSSRFGTPEHAQEACSEGVDTCNRKMMEAEELRTRLEASSWDSSASSSGSARSGSEAPLLSAQPSDCESPELAGPSDDDVPMLERLRGRPAVTHYHVRFV